MTEPNGLGVDERLERLIRDPNSIDRFWVKLSGPLYRLFDYQPKIETKHITAYVTAMGRSGTLAPDSGEMHAAATREFARNLDALEHACQLYGTLDPKLLNWTVRLHRILGQAERVARRRQTHGLDAPTEAERRALDQASERALHPLLSSEGASPGAQARIDSVESLLDAAREETNFLGRRRHLLEAARELLLDSSAQIANGAAAAARLERIAHEIGELDRLEAMGVRSDVSLFHQLETSRAERDPQRLNAILSTLESQALARGDTRVSELTQAALRELWQGQDRFAPEHRAASLSRSGAQTFQPEVLAAARRGLLEAQEHYQAERLDQGKPRYGQVLDEVAQRYLSEAPDTELIQSALYVDGCVDVGGVLSPHRVFEPVRVVREVRFPTQNLTLATAHGIEDAPEAIINDPRMILMDLAANRLLTRRYLGVETRHVERRVMSSEVRVFLLDGSGSMLGPRARMRDAILVAELSTMIARLNDADRWLTPTLYYRYFNQELGAVVKVATAAEAMQAVENVLGRLRHGGTDIEGALIGSFETVRQAREGADDLSRAQIVLITDGEAKVDEDAITRAREAAGSVPIGVSIIALGEENPTLRALAARQRERGERVFYQFLDDRMLEKLAKGQSTSLSLHLPDALAATPPSDALTELLDEMATLRRERDDEGLSRLRTEAEALADVGLSRSDLSEADRARLLLLSRDHTVLRERFARWFPRPRAADGEDAAALSGATLMPSDDDQERLATVLGILTAVTDVTELVGDEPHARRADAMELCERLLWESGLSFLHYQKLCERYPHAFEAALTRLHQVVERSAVTGATVARAS